MTIEISGSNQAAQTLTNTVTGNGNGNAPARNETNSVTTEAGRDTVSLTGTAQHLRNLEHGLASQPVVDTQRVAATRQAIEDGSYQIDPSRIANKMINLERALSGAQ